MLLLESVYLGLMVFALFLFVQTKELGPDRPIPQDEGSRARYFAARILASLKEKLSHVVPLKVGPLEFVFRSPQGLETQKIWCDEGRLLLQSGESPPATLHQLGRGGRIEFRRIGSSLLIEVSSRIEALHPYEFTLRLPLAV